MYPPHYGLPSTSAGEAALFVPWAEKTKGDGDLCEYLQLRSTSCKHCYKCIRHCPVKAISFSSDKEQVKIVDEDCILCGECFVNCPQHAKSIRDDVADARLLIRGEADVYASVAPSFAANYRGAGIASLRRALVRLGFKDAFETAEGATVVKGRYDELLRSGRPRVVVSSCCYSVNMLIQKYFPKILGCLAPVESPMQTHSKLIKARFPGAKTVFIGPCVSKKAEADAGRGAEGAVDCALTFGELDAWLAEEGLEIERGLPDDDEGGKARFFPLAGGILRSMDADEPGYSYVTVDGVKKCMDTLREIEAGSLDGYFIEMSACVGSCINGPAMKQEGRSGVRDWIAVERYASSAEGRDFPEPAPTDLRVEKSFRATPVRKVFPGRQAIEEVLLAQGKTKPEDELNCGSCGYDTCREKAVAVIVGKADSAMCLPYLMKRAQSFSDNIIENSPNGIIVLGESMVIHQLNRAALRIMNLRSADDVVGMDVSCILDPVPIMQVAATGNNVYEKRVYMVEYQRYVMQTVILDGENKIVIVIMRDITDEEQGRARKVEICRQTIDITDKVIEKQMRSVQEIASLLGETAAETQIALSKLKETIHNEQFLH